MNCPFISCHPYSGQEWVSAGLQWKQLLIKICCLLGSQWTKCTGDLWAVVNPWRGSVSPASCLSYLKNISVVFLSLSCTEAADCHVYFGWMWERVISCVPTSQLITNRCNFGVALAAVDGVCFPPPLPSGGECVRAGLQTVMADRHNSFLMPVSRTRLKCMVAGQKSTWATELELKRRFCVFWLEQHEVGEMIPGCVHMVRCYVTVLRLKVFLNNSTSFQTEPHNPYLHQVWCTHTYTAHSLHIQHTHLIAGNDQFSHTVCGIAALLQ